MGVRSKVADPSRRRAVACSKPSEGAGETCVAGGVVGPEGEGEGVVDLDLLSELK